jgi:hypothetical protein
METDPSVTGMLSALWMTVALLAGGYARTRNRSALAWFVGTVIFGPIAAFLLVVWPAREPDSVEPVEPRLTPEP